MDYQFKIEYSLSQLCDLALFMGNLKLGNDILTLLMTVRNQYSNLVLNFDIDLTTSVSSTGFASKTSIDKVLDSVKPK